MRTHTFTGNTSREVLDKVKEALGDDALILSNRTRDGAIEIVALAATEIGVPAQPAIERTRVHAAAARAAFAPPAPAQAAAEYQTMAEELAAAMDEHAAMTQQPAQKPAREVKHFQRIERPAPQAAAPAPALTLVTQPQPQPQPEAPKAQSADIDGILSEIQNLKNVLRSEIAAFATTEPAAAAKPRHSLVRELLNAGFSAQLARRLAGDPQAANPVRNMEQVAARLQDEIQLAGADDIINQGGVYALVGPTGVGKTTTVAKLAARAVVRFGASKVALLTTDTYRIGAHDQLKIYGRILSVPVHAIRDADDLAATLEQLAGKHLVLIDTIGMSQRDRMVAEQAAMLSGTDRVKRVLLVSTTANAATLNQVVSIYKATGVEGCILTKTDEAASLAPALDAVVRHELPLHYVTDGQRVPEDLQLPDVAALAHDALNAPADDAFDLGIDELPLLTQAAPAGNSAPAAPAVPASISAPAVPAAPAAPMPVMPVMHAMPVSAGALSVVHG